MFGFVYEIYEIADIFLLDLLLLHILSTYYHCYADDTQLYLSFKPQDVCKLQISQRCLDSVKSWRLTIFWCAPDRFVPEVMESPLATFPKSSISNLWIIFYSAFTLDGHVKSRFRFYRLRNIASFHCVMMENVINAFISSLLDNCNSQFTCLNKASLERLQPIQ